MDVEKRRKRLHELSDLLWQKLGDKGKKLPTGPDAGDGEPMVEAGNGAERPEEGAGADHSDVEKLKLADYRPPKTDRYEIVHPIGVGGTGIVYKATEKGQTGPPRALKVLRPDRDTPFFRRRFERERQAYSQLDHPSIAKCLAEGETEDRRPYLVIEYFESALPITEYCNKNDLSPEARLELFRKLCEAIQYAHGKRVLHCDLKPTNILVTPDGKIHIVDFGLAKIVAGEFTSATSVAGSTGPLWMATPEYASPEQLLSKPPTVQFDVYSLGALLSEQMAEKRPFDFGEVQPLEFLRRKTTPLKPKNVAAQLSKVPADKREDLSLIICKAMAVDMSDRIVSVDKLAGCIESLLAGQPLPIRKITRGYDVRKFIERHETLTAVATIAVLLTVGAAMSFGIRQAAKARAAEAKAREAEAKAATLEKRAVGTLGGYAYSEPGQTLSPMWRVFGAEVRPEVESSPVLNAAILSWCQGGPLEKEKDSSVIFVCGELTQSRAAHQLRTLAENGNTAAATALAAVEFTSAPAESFRWARVSAAHRSAAGEYFMGAHYLTGVAIARDDEKALQWFIKAASQDDLRAEGRLCSLLQNSEEPRWALFLDSLLGGPEIRLRRDLRSNRESYAWCSLAVSNHNSGSGAEDIRQEAIRNREWVIREAPNAVAAGDMLRKQWQRRVKALRR